MKPASILEREVGGGGEMDVAPFKTNAGTRPDKDLQYGDSACQLILCLAKENLEYFFYNYLFHLSEA